MGKRFLQQSKLYSWLPRLQTKFPFMCSLGLSSRTPVFYVAVPQSLLSSRPSANSRMNLQTAYYPTCFPAQTQTMPRSRTLLIWRTTFFFTIREAFPRSAFDLGKIALRLKSDLPRSSRERNIPTSGQLLELLQICMT
jgi:hypothetical protein